ncbi:unnamed protein product [Rotaria magnacalcarata]
MAANVDDEKVPDEFRLQLLLNKQKLEYQLEKKKQMQEMKYKHELETRKIIEETNRQRQREIEETKRRREIEETKRQHEIEKNKRKKLKLEFDSSSLKRSRFLLTNHADFYTIHVGKNLKLFDIIDLLEDNECFNDNILSYIEDYLKNSSCDGKTTENLIQTAFDNLIVNLLNTLSHATSLKYLDTSSSYLQDKFRPDCTFIYKNININIETQQQLLEDFVVFVGDLKAADVRLTDRAAMGQILQYLKVLIDVQQRQKIYGFLSNYKHMKFFYVEKLSSNSYEYFESQELEMFSSLSETSSSSSSRSRRKINQNITNLTINKDSWKIFTKFLTMNYEFYQYRRLNIDPCDDLLTNRYMISKRLGNGLTSTVYLLEKIINKSSVKTLSFYVIKILTNNSYAKYFTTEMKITKELKKFHNSKKFNLYFQDILYSLSSDKYLFFKKELQFIESLSLEQSKQLIDIVHYLYNCHVIHRDIRPQNLMFDYDTNHIKLIDFGCAITYDIDDKAGSIEIIGTTIYAGLRFLDFCSKLITGVYLPYYEYERTFDLQCALNIIISMCNYDIKEKIYSIEILPDIHKKQSKILELWQDTQRTNKHYSKLLNLIKDLDKLYKSSTFDVFKDEIEQIFDQ